MMRIILKPLLYGLLIAAGLVLGIFLSPTHQQQNFWGSHDKLSQIIQLINQVYVNEVNTDSFETASINQMLASLDPHSVYIPAIDLKQANEGLEGNFEGIGIEFTIIMDSIYVVRVIPGGPASKAGLEAGDRLLFVDSVKVFKTNITNDKVFKLLRGAAQSKVLLKYFSSSTQQIKVATITRGQIPIFSVDAAIMLNNETGYIKVDRFATNTHNEFLDALDKLKKQHLKNLVLDLRDNPGGYLSAATAIADEFIGGSKLLVYTQGKKQLRTEYKTENDGAFENGKLIILIDEGSASASEIVSGAIQDWDRGVLLGRRSFGKGLVQEPFELSDGSAVRLTVSRYYTPSGRCIQKNYANGYAEYQNEIHERYQHGELNTDGHAKVNDSTPYKTANGRVVYASGGINPDVYVTVDTSYLNPFYYAVFENNVLNQVCIAYLDKERRKLLANYKNADLFNLNFKTPPVIWNQLVTQTQLNQKQAFDGLAIKQTEMQLMMLAKATIARHLFGDEAYHRVVTSSDKMISKALQTFNVNYQQLLKP